MSNTQPAGTEVLYQMPAVGATIVSTTASVVTGNAAGNPAYQLPALASIWSPDKLPGKGILIQASGADFAFMDNITEMDTTNPYAVSIEDLMDEDGDGFYSAVNTLLWLVNWWGQERKES